MSTHVPRRVQLHRHSKQLELDYGDGETYRLPCEYLRVFSPSAEVRGHGPGEEVLQTGKRHVTITKIEASGNYALKLSFDDGHDTGIYSWDYLYQLCREQESRWQDYLQRLKAAQGNREPQGPVIIARDATRQDTN